MKVHHLLSDNIDTENINFETEPALIKGQGRWPSEVPSSLNYSWGPVFYATSSPKSCLLNDKLPIKSGTQRAGDWPAPFSPCGTGLGVIWPFCKFSFRCWLLLMNSCCGKGQTQNGRRKKLKLQGRQEQGSASHSERGAGGCFTCTHKNGPAHIHWHIWHWGQSCLSAIWRATLLRVSKGWSASAAKTISLEHLPVFISCQINQMDLVSKPADKTLKVLLCFSSLLWAPLQS